MSELEKKIIEFCADYSMNPEPFLRDNLRAVNALFSYMRENEKALFRISALVNAQDRTLEAIDKDALYDICAYMMHVDEVCKPVDAAQKISAPLGNRLAPGHLKRLENLWRSRPEDIMMAVIRSMDDETCLLAA